jgi:hypothetical protein
MRGESEIRINVIRDPDVLRAFVEPLARSPLVRLGRIKPWNPAASEVQFPRCDCVTADYVLVPVAVSCLDVADWQVYERLSDGGCMVAHAAIEDALATAVAGLPGFRRSPERYVFLQLGDLISVFEPFAGSVVLKVSPHRATPRCIALPYYLEDFDRPPTRAAARTARPIAECTSDFGFRGDSSYTTVRRAIPAAVAALERCGYRCSFTQVGYHDRQEADHIAYLALLDETRFILCPRGMAVNSRRFYETLAFGRIPVLVADDARLPLDWILDWDACAVRVPEAQFEHIADYVESFLGRTTLAKASAHARQIYDDYLTLDQVGRLIRLSLARLKAVATGR